MTVTITRKRHFRGYGRLHPFGYLYEVNGDHACTSLAEARSIARRLYPSHIIVEAWHASAKKGDK